mmetsp:Transcript_10934/g.17268  ORF Transcript_10934/g.17268 Transcript_10934/m.17268 type:complete len:88 (+) Transcript_10934:782-1045(+)
MLEAPPSSGDGVFNSTSDEESELEIMIAVPKNVVTAYKDLVENLASPQSPCPEVQPCPTVVPTPTSRPLTAINTGLNPPASKAFGRM